MLKIIKPQLKKGAIERSIELRILSQCFAQELCDYSLGGTCWALEDLMGPMLLSFCIT